MPFCTCSCRIVSVPELSWRATTHNNCHIYTGYQSGKLKITPSTFCEMLGMNYYLLWLLQNFMTTLEIRTKNLSRIHLKRDKTLTDKKKLIVSLTLYHFLLTGRGPTWGHSPQRMICWFLDQGQVHPPLTKRNYYNDNWKSVVITHTFWATAISVNIYGAMITWYCCTKLLNLLHPR